MMSDDTLRDATDVPSDDELAETAAQKPLTDAVFGAMSDDTLRDAKAHNGRIR